MTSPLTLISLPLFPLHAVLFPGGHLPLRVFEARYRSMVHGCREAGAPFGVVTLLSGQEIHQPHLPPETFYATGTIAAIDSLSPLSTGLELLHCSGRERFHIATARKLPLGLWVADVELLPADHTVPIPSYLRHTATTLRLVLQKIPQNHLEGATDAQFADCGWVANRWCELLPMERKLQLCLLELDSPLVRLELVADTLERAGITP